MKVIVAGMPKTGTKSLVYALTELGYNVHDAMEHFSYYYNDWNRIMVTGGTTEDFRRMYEKVDAVTDIPAAYYWEEIHKAFPDAKIVLMQRESEEAWWESAKEQSKQLLTVPILMAWLLSPTMRRLRGFIDTMSRAIFGACRPYPLFWEPEYNAMQTKLTYRRHNAYVLQNAPKDKLLVFSVKEGWAPLCKFLGKEIPNTPFPHKNKRGTRVVGLLKENPVTKKVQLEIALTLGAIALFASYTTYKVYCADSMVDLVYDCVDAGKGWLSYMYQFLPTTK